MERQTKSGQSLLRAALGSMKCLPSGVIFDAESRHHIDIAGICAESAQNGIFKLTAPPSNVFEKQKNTGSLIFCEPSNYPIILIFEKFWYGLRALPSEIF